jgi:hypothetical protein
LFRREGFPQERVLCVIRSANNVLLDVAGHLGQSHARHHQLQGLGECHTIHVGHHYVGENQI